MQGGLKSALLTVSILLAYPTLQADDHKGQELSVEKKDLDSLAHQGDVDLEDVNVKGPVSIDGKLKAKRATFHSLAVKGPVELEKVVVTSNANIDGKAKIEESMFYGVVSIDGRGEIEKVGIPVQLNVVGRLMIESGVVGSLNVEGKTDMKDMVVLGPANIEGRLTAERSYFFGSIQVVAEIVEFTGSILKDIQIESSGEEAPRLYLTSTVVTGDISFVEGEGEVFQNGAKILGEVRGGKIIES